MKTNDLLRKGNSFSVLSMLISQEVLEEKQCVVDTDTGMLRCYILSLACLSLCWIIPSVRTSWLSVCQVSVLSTRESRGKSEPACSLSPFCKPAHHPVRRMEQGTDEAAEPPVAHSCPTLCDPMGCSTPGSPVLHHLSELAQTHVHWVGDAIQPHHPVVPFSSCLQSFPASRSFPMSQLFASGGDSIGASASALALPVNFQGWFHLRLILERLSDTLFTHFSWGFGYIHGLLIQFEQDNWSKITVREKLRIKSLRSGYYKKHLYSCFLIQRFHLFMQVF